MSDIENKADALADKTRYLEEFQVGERWISSPTVITEEEIVAYGLANDPQPMHTDPQWAKTGPFGGLIASGWQIAALSMRVFVQSGGYGKTPVIGMGIDQLRWRKPVRAADVLTVEREVVEIIRSQSQPDRGTLHTQVSVRNQAGEVVMTLLTLGRVPARPVPAGDV